MVSPYSREDLTPLLLSIVQEFRADIGTLHLLDLKDGLLHLAASVGSFPPPVLELIRTVPIGKGIAGETARRREPVSICNIKRDESGVTQPGAKTLPTQGALCVPILDGDHLVGTLGIGCNGERIFSEQETQRLLEVARRLAPDLNRA
jgi:GAF domain-containing protein